MEMPLISFISVLHFLSLDILFDLLNQFSAEFLGIRWPVPIALLRVVLHEDIIYP